jgi:hypothetical protein
MAVWLPAQVYPLSLPVSPTGSLELCASASTNRYTHTHTLSLSLSLSLRYVPVSLQARCGDLDVALTLGSRPSFNLQAESGSSADAELPTRIYKHIQVLGHQHINPAGGAVVISALCVRRLLPRADMLRSLSYTDTQTHRDTQSAPSSYHSLPACMPAVLPACLPACLPAYPERVNRITNTVRVAKP